MKVLVSGPFILIQEEIIRGGVSICGVREAGKQVIIMPQFASYIGGYYPDISVAYTIIVV